MALLGLVKSTMATELKLNETKMQHKHVVQSGHKQLDSPQHPNIHTVELSALI